MAVLHAALVHLAKASQPAQADIAFGSSTVDKILRKYVKSNRCMILECVIKKSNSTDSLINQDLIEQIKLMATSTNPAKTLGKIEAILKTRRNLAQNAAPLLLIEALMCELR